MTFRKMSTFKIKMIFWQKIISIYLFRIKYKETNPALCQSKAMKK